MVNLDNKTLTSEFGIGLRYIGTLSFALHLHFGQTMLMKHWFMIALSECLAKRFRCFFITLLSFSRANCLGISEMFVVPFTEYRFPDSVATRKTI